MRRKTEGLFALLILLALLCSGCSYRKGDRTLIAKAGNVSFYGEDYRYIKEKNRVQLYGEKKEEELDAGEKNELIEAVEWEMKRYAAVEAAAEKYGVSLSEKDDALIADEIKETKESFESADGYYDYLESLFMSENVFYMQRRNMVLEEKLYNQIYAEISRELTEEQLDKDVRDYCYAAVQILWTGENAQKNLEKIRNTIVTTEDFYKKMQAYSLDTVKDVRVCIKGEMIKEFEDAALSLAPGGISGVVVSSVGAHIILRVELTEDLIAAQRSRLREKDIARIFREMLDQTAKSIRIEYEDQS